MASDALAQLKPLIPPPPIGWWPPAPGWIICACAGIGLLILAVIFLLMWLKHRRHTRYQREAAAMIQDGQPREPRQQLEHIAQVMRRAAIYVWGREVAGTQPWTEIFAFQALDTGSKKTMPFDADSLALLTDYLYKRFNPSAAQVQILQQQTLTWLKTLPPVIR